MNKDVKATPSDSLVSGQEIYPEASGRADFLIIVIYAITLLYTTPCFRLNNNIIVLHE